MGGSSLGRISSARTHPADPEPRASHLRCAQSRPEALPLHPRADVPSGRLRSGIATAAGGVRGQLESDSWSRDRGRSLGHLESEIAEESGSSWNQR